MVWSTALDYRSIIAEQSARLLEVLEAGPLDAPVPGTPEWSLGDLGVHMADVQRWAAQVITAGSLEPPGPLTDPTDPTDPAGALAAATETLLAALDQADPDDGCWNFSTGPQRMSFWFRRQALEVVVHRWDAESAVSDAPTPIEPRLGADIVDEFINITLQRVIDREGIDLGAVTGDVHVHCTDTDDIDAAGEWTFEVDNGELVVSDQHRKSAVALRGAAGDLALFLYNRIPIERIEVFGDRDVLRSWGPVFEF